MKKYMILFFAFFYFSCQQRDEKKIESIRVWYYNGIFYSTLAINCDEIIYQADKVDTTKVLLDDGSCLPKPASILEVVITNENVLREIGIELGKREIGNKCNIDARMKCYITYHNAKVDSLCVGDIPAYGIFNNKPVILTNRLAYLIRKHCDFYQWVDIEDLKTFEELNDSSFEREKVKSHSGEEY